MKITIESTDRTMRFRGGMCRLWQGTDDKGQPVIAMVAGIGVPDGLDDGRYDVSGLEPIPGKPKVRVVAGPDQPLHTLS